MATLSQLRDGLKTRLDTISSMHAYDVLPENITVPAAIVRPLDQDYYSNLSGDPKTRFEILVLVQMAKVNSAQDALDAYLSATGSSSVKVAIEGDKTLSGNCDTLFVSGWRDYGGIILNGIEYLSARIEVEVTE